MDAPSLLVRVQNFIKQEVKKNSYKSFRPRDLFNKLAEAVDDVNIKEQDKMKSKKVDPPRFPSFSE